MHTGGAVASNQLFKLAEIFAVPVKSLSSAPTNDAMLCVQDEVQLGGIKHGIGHSYRRFQLRSMQAKCILGGTDGQWRNGKIAESVAG